MSSTAVPRISYRTPYATKHASRLALLAALLIAGGCFLQGWGALQPMRSKLHATQFRIGADDVTQLHFLLLDHGLLELDKRLVLPSTRAVAPASVRDGLATISIVTDEEGLYAPERGIVVNAEEKGRRWERPATISYFENGTLRYEAHAGLRIHGGRSREGGIKSYQIVFRRSYAGKARTPAGVFFGPDGPAVQRLVLINTKKQRRFFNALAYDIAASVGCITSRHQPVRVFLNGERVPSGYYMVEHQSREFLKQRHGHDDFEWVRLKGEASPPLSFDLFRTWLNLGRTFVNMRSAAERYDLENLCAWIFAVTFCDTDDEDQGAYYKDRRNAAAVWRSLTWDMDNSFDYAKHEKKQKFEFERVRGTRARLFRQLCENDPAFRDHFRGYAERMLQEKVAPAQIRALVAKYRALIATDTFVHEREELSESVDRIQGFLLDRHRAYLGGLDRYYASLK